MRRLLVLTLIGLLLASTAGALAAPGRSGNEDERSDNGRHRGPPAPIGAFALDRSLQEVDGSHVSFAYSDAGIERFAAGGRTLFDLRVEGAEGDDRRDPRIQSQASIFRLRAPNFSFIAHDNPMATTKVETEGQAILTFADGAVLSDRDEDTVRFRVGNATGAIRSEDLRVEGRTVVGEGSLLIFLDKARGSFDKHRPDIGTAIARGHVGAEATFNALDGDVEEEVVSYGNVTMTTVKADEGNITLLVEGHGTQGRVLVLNVDGRVLGADRADKLQVMLDNVSIGSADDLADILDPDNDGYEPESYLVYDPLAEAFQLMVSVPHYSVHTLSVTTLLELVKPSVVVGVLAGLILLVPAAGVLFRRR